MTKDEYIKWCNDAITPLMAMDPAPNNLGTVMQLLVDAKLAEVLHGRQVQIISEDWRDRSVFIDDVINDKWLREHPLAKKRQFEPFEEFVEGHGGNDDIILVAIDDEEATDDELGIVFDLVNNLGADTD